MPDNPTQSLEEIPAPSGPEPQFDADADAVRPTPRPRCKNCLKCGSTLQKIRSLATNKSRKYFGSNRNKVAETYTATNPVGAPRLKYKMLRANFERVSSEIQKFCDIFNNEKRSGNGSREADVMTSDAKKPFKYIPTRDKVCFFEKWAGCQARARARHAQSTPPRANIRRVATQNPSP